MSAENWWQLMVMLLLEVTLMVAVTGWVARRCQRPDRQRAVWRGGALVILGLLVCEVAGARYAIDGFRGQTRGNRNSPTLVIEQVTIPLIPQVITPEPQWTPTRNRVSPKESPFSIALRSFWPGLIWFGGAGAWLGWMGICRWMVFRKKRQWAWVTEPLLNQKAARLGERLGLKGTVPLALSDELQGPITCGFLKPCVCLPADFVQTFSPSQQEVMLAHELAHVAARDPQWFCLMDGLAALLWWHPAVWWMRRQLQAVSEQAADDASLLIQGGPGVLAESLVMVAQRLTTAGSFGHLGIEGNGYRSSLGRRVARLVDLPEAGWKPPSRTLGWIAASVGMVLLPVVFLVSGKVMDATGYNERNGWASSPLGAAWAQLSMPVASQSAKAQAPKRLAALPESTPQKEVSDSAKAPNPGSPQPGIPAASLKQPSRDPLIGTTVKSLGPFAGVPLREVIRQLRDALVVPSGQQGVNFLIATPEVADVHLDLQPAIKDISLRSALDRITNSFLTPLCYSVSSSSAGYVMVTLQSTPPLPALLTRSYSLDVRTVAQVLEVPGYGGLPNSKVQSRKTNELAEKMFEFLGRFGVSREPPQQAFFNENNGLLLIRASEPDHQLVETAISALSVRPPQLTMEIKYAELPVETARTLGLPGLLGSSSDNVPTSTTLVPGRTSPRLPVGQAAFQTSSNLPTAASTAILSPLQLKEILGKLQRIDGANILSAPSVTTLSGRQTQVKSVEVRWVVTDLDLTDPDTIQPIATPFESGPVLDLLPYVASDGYTIDMTLIPSVKEFLGYDTNNVERFQAVSPRSRQAVPRPRFRVRQVIANVRALDGQTVVVSPGAAEMEDPNDPAPAGSRRLIKKELWVFVTPRLIDPAGNPSHSDAEIKAASLGLQKESPPTSVPR